MNHRPKILKIKRHILTEEEAAQLATEMREYIDKNISIEYITNLLLQDIVGFFHKYDVRASFTIIVPHERLEKLLTKEEMENN